MAKDDFITLVNETLEEDMEVLRNLFESDFVPILKERQRLERKAFDDAYGEVEILESEVV